MVLWAYTYVHTTVILRNKKLGMQKGFSIEDIGCYSNIISQNLFVQRKCLYILQLDCSIRVSRYLANFHARIFV